MNVQANHHPSLPLAAGACFVLCLFVGFQPMPRDPDLWFHLAGGRYILEHGEVPQADPFSFTKHGELWVPHSWLFDVAVYLGWTHLGPRTAEAVAAITFAAALMFTFAVLARQVPNPLVAAVICMALAIGAGNARGLRPQMLSLLLASATIWTLVQHRSSPTRRILWLLPVMFLFWAQVHGACVMGLALVAVWIGGRTLTHWTSRERGEVQTRSSEIRTALAALGLCIAAVLVTPHAITHFSYSALTMNLGGLRYTSEWQPPKALSLEVPDVHIYLLFVGVVALLARTRRRADWAEIALFTALSMLAFSGARHIPLACVAAAPLIANCLAANSSRAAAICPAIQAAVPVTLATGVAVLALSWSTFGRIQTRYAAAEPVIGGRALACLASATRVFTTYNTGSYVLWSGPDHLRVFIDSRADVYGDEIIESALRAQSGRDWQALFDDQAIDAAVVAPSDPLAKALQHDTAWRLIATDISALTFIRVAAGT
jgi:hypothetical protein